jgi:hypothetical protein
MSPDLPRGTGKPIGEDLNVDDEGSEQYRFWCCTPPYAQNPLHYIGFGVVLLRMLTPKDLGIIIIKVTCIVSLKCKIIFNITSTYITSVICGNVGFLAGTIMLEVAYSMTTVALNIGGATGGCG